MTDNASPLVRLGTKKTESVACFGFVHCLKEAVFSNSERYLRGIKQAKFKLTRSVLVESHCVMSAERPELMGGGQMSLFGVGVFRSLWLKAVSAQDSRYLVSPRVR